MTARRMHASFPISFSSTREREAFLSRPNEVVFDFVSIRVIKIGWRLRKMAAELKEMGKELRELEE